MIKNNLDNFFIMPSEMRIIDACICGGKIYGYETEKGNIRYYKDSYLKEIKTCVKCHEEMTKEESPEYKNILEVSRKNTEIKKSYEVVNVINF